MNTEPYQRKLETLRALQHEKEAELEFHLVKVEKLKDQLINVKLDYARTANEPLPIFSLPNEISLIIFRDVRYCNWLGPPAEPNLEYRCDTKRNYDDHEQCRLCRSAAMDISQVCHSWRALALGSPELWSTFNYTGREWGFSNIRLLLYLQRSRERLLDIRLDFPLDCHDQIPSVVDMLFPHFSRVRLLSLRVDSSHDPADFFNCMQHYVSADNLETLEVFTFRSFHDWRGDWDWETDGRPIFKNRMAPKLTSLRIQSSDYNLFLPKSSETHITVLQFDSIIEMDWLTFNRVLTLPALSTLTLSTDMDAPPPQQSSIIAPNLQYLRTRSEETMSYICLYLQAPCLELLVLRGIHIYGWQFPSTGVFDKQYEPFPSLKTICFADCHAPLVNSFLNELAQATTSVTHLVVYHGPHFYFPATANIRSVFSTILADSNVIYWPKLEAISYHRSQHPELRGEINVTQLAEMLKHRAVQLRTHCTYQFFDEDLDKLEDAEGSAGTLWRSLRTGDFHKTVTSRMQDPMEWCPWPSQPSTEFHYSSELEFFMVI